MATNANNYRDNVFTTPFKDGSSKPGTRKEDWVYRDGQWYVNGKARTPATADEKQNLADKGVTDKTALRDKLINDGYDPTKADQLADLMITRSSTQPSLTTPNVGQATAGSIDAAQAQQAGQIEEVTFQDAMSSGIPIGNTDVTTREVEEEELVGHQLGLLLDENGPYIQRAKQRAIELANQRGQLGSSFAAGAAGRAATDAALPIATADAQAYRDVATANMNALNEFALANLQRATQLETSVLDANTRIKMANLDSEVRILLGNLDALTQTNIANLDATTRTSIANLQSATQIAVQSMQDSLNLTMQSRQMTHDVGMEQLQQHGRVELKNLDYGLQKLLNEAGYEHDFDMSNLDHEEQLRVNEILQGYELDRMAQDNSNKRRTEHATLASQAQINYINYLTAYAGTDMDANAAKRLQQDAWNNLQAEFAMINGLYPELNPITPTRG
jgi:hypothetical protein